ncbi:uncharacterized protein LOC105695501 isoform X2 [Orussus abietinus]|uniref:uncharacterized protein LOC105695501 isoform X2 n=1 Tax=Orussus abietinus TaxID=222816 RepID=UPI0006261651|nr:uncharacterized protein LOC105695501 isoform X2 [Orussus abietinus]
MADVLIRRIWQEQNMPCGTRTPFLSHIVRTDIYKWCHQNSLIGTSSEGISSWFASRNLTLSSNRRWSTGSKVTKDLQHESEGNMALKPLMYSSAIGKSLVDSYKFLTKQCLTADMTEDFLLPSAYMNGETKKSKGRNFILKSDTRDEVGSRRLSERPQRFYSRLLNPSRPLRLVRSLENRASETNSPVKVNNKLRGKQPLTPPLLPSKRSRKSALETGEPSLTPSPTLACNRKTRSRFADWNKRGTQKTMFDVSMTSPVSSDGKEPNTCPICLRVFTTGRGIQVHIKSHRTDNCPICNVPTLTKEEFGSHMKSHMNVVSRQEKVQERPNNNLISAEADKKHLEEASTVCCRSPRKVT